MTAPTNPPDHNTLYVNDAELIRRLGLPEKSARELLRALDRNPNSRFPQKNPLFGNMRYWPEIRSYLDTMEQRRLERPQPKRDGYGRVA